MVVWASSPPNIEGGSEGNGRNPAAGQGAAGVVDGTTMTDDGDVTSDWLGKKMGRRSSCRGRVKALRLRGDHVRSVITASGNMHRKARNTPVLPIPHEAGSKGRSARLGLSRELATLRFSRGGSPSVTRWIFPAPSWPATGSRGAARARTIREAAPVRRAPSRGSHEP
jgi:hypothetical protein